MKQYNFFANSTKTVAGYFRDEAAMTFDLLLDWQNNNLILGSCVEMGVWHGKSAGLIALHSQDTKFHMVDIAANRLHSKIEHTFNLLELSLSDKNYNLHDMASQNILQDEQLSKQYRCSRFIHIDGLHDGPTTYNDIKIADFLCSEKGIVVIDDFFSPAFPNVTEAFYRYVSLHPYSFTLFMVGGRKGFLARPEFVGQYRKLIYDKLLDYLEENNFEMTLHKHGTDADCYAIGLEWRGKNQDRYHGLHISNLG